GREGRHARGGARRRPPGLLRGPRSAGRAPGRLGADPHLPSAGAGGRQPAGRPGHRRDARDDDRTAAAACGDGGRLSQRRDRAGGERMTIVETPGLSTAAAPGVDPITFEIVRHRLWTITDEMALTLIKTAGNPSITEAHDFMVALFTADGEIALGGWGGNRHVSCTALACKGILDRFPLGDLHETDVFLLNDHYIAAIHQPDMYVISPIHWEGELIGWTANFTHLADIGGIDPGSSPRATEVVQEGLRIPGLRIADRGVLRQDVWDTLLHMTREPEMNALQLKAQMAANNTGKEKVRALIAKVGIAQYHAIVRQMIAHSE